MPVKTAPSAWLWFSVMLSLPTAQATETEAPLPLELLEFLADWQDSAGELVDPAMLEPAAAPPGDPPLPETVTDE